MADGVSTRKRTSVASGGGSDDWTSNKRRKKKDRGGGASGSDKAAAEVQGVVISKAPEACAPQLTLSKDQLTVTGENGFRMARATHGVSNGVWYWECSVLEPDMPGGHCRLGWTLQTGNLQAPVGYDKSSYAYRDISGSKVHESLRTDNYGEAWGPGDVIGFLISVTPLGQEEACDPVRDPNKLGGTEDAGGKGKGGGMGVGGGGYGGAASSGSSGTGVGVGSNEIRFFKNGMDQGVAFSGIEPGTYFPAISLYMGGKVRVNFGPAFVYPPASTLRCKAVSSLKHMPKEDIKAQRQRVEEERLAKRGHSASPTSTVSTNSVGAGNVGGKNSSGGGSGSGSGISFTSPRASGGS